MTAPQAGDAAYVEPVNGERLRRLANYLGRTHQMTAAREVDRAAEEIDRLTRLRDDIEHALRPCNGTTYADIDGRTTPEVVEEVVEALRAYNEPSPPEDGDG